jgi:DNA-binding transcriptional regulator YiaG
MQAGPDPPGLFKRHGEVLEPELSRIIRAIRESSLSQSEFACLIGVSVKRLQNWEQDRRRPTGPAATLLRIIAYEPRLAVKAIHQT